LDKKFKWKETCVFFQGEEREKGKEKKKPIEATSVVRRHHAPIHKKYLGEPLW
jgi:hypothetical protein